MFDNPAKSVSEYLKGLPIAKVTPEKYIKTYEASRKPSARQH